MATPLAFGGGKKNTLRTIGLAINKQSVGVRESLAVPAFGCLLTLLKTITITKCWAVGGTPAGSGGLLPPAPAGVLPAAFLLLLLLWFLVGLTVSRRLVPLTTPLRLQFVYLLLTRWFGECSFCLRQRLTV